MTSMRWACALIALVGASAAQAEDDYIQLSTGADYSSGDYGASETTDMLAVPVTVKVKTGDLTLKASVPWLHVTGPADVIPGDGGTGHGNGNGGGPGGGGGGAGVTTRSGLGDANLAATYDFGLADSTWLGVTGKVKLPTASEAKSLGTGATDFTLQGDLLQSFGDLSVSLGGGRRFNGSTAELPLSDVWQAEAGLYYTAGPTQFGLDYEWRGASLPLAGDRSEVTGSVTHKLSDALRLQGYAYTGLADGSPDAGIGAQVLYRWGY